MRRCLARDLAASEAAYRDLHQRFEAMVAERDLAQQQRQMAIAGWRPSSLSDWTLPWRYDSALLVDLPRRLSVIRSAALTLPCTCRHDHDGVIGLPCARCQIVTEAEGEKL